MCVLKLIDTYMELNNNFNNCGTFCERAVRGDKFGQDINCGKILNNCQVTRYDGLWFRLGWLVQFV